MPAASECATLTLLPWCVDLPGRCLTLPTRGLRLFSFNFIALPTHTDRLHTYHRVCGSNTVCINGQCAACKPGWGNCDGNWDNGGLGVYLISVASFFFS